MQCFNEFQRSALSGLKCGVQGQGGREEDDKAGDTFPFHRQHGSRERGQQGSKRYTGAGETWEQGGHGSRGDREDMGAGGQD